MFYQSLPIWLDALIQFTNDYHWFANASLIIALVNSSPLVAHVLPITNLPMALGNLPIAANGLLLVPIGNNMQDSEMEPILVCLVKPVCACWKNLISREMIRV